jgi:hypothetical protein
MDSALIDIWGVRCLPNQRLGVRSFIPYRLFCSTLNFQNRCGLWGISPAISTLLSQLGGDSMSKAIGICAIGQTAAAAVAPVDASQILVDVCNFRCISNLLMLPYPSSVAYWFLVVPNILGQVLLMAHHHGTGGIIWGFGEFTKQ